MAICPQRVCGYVTGKQVWLYERKCGYVTVEQRRGYVTLSMASRRLCVSRAISRYFTWSSDRCPT
eukprot:3851274-Rhodomonas_salina.1